MYRARQKLEEATRQHAPTPAPKIEAAQVVAASRDLATLAKPSPAEAHKVLCSVVEPILMRPVPGRRLRGRDRLERQHGRPRGRPDSALRELRGPQYGFSCTGNFVILRQIGERGRCQYPGRGHLLHGQGLCDVHRNQLRRGMEPKSSAATEKATADVNWGVSQLAAQNGRAAPPVSTHHRKN